MRAGALWQPALPLLVLVAISDYSNALLSDGIPLLQREGRPGLISDLRTTWNGLLGYSAATLLQARETNVTSSNVGGSQSGRMQCTISRSLSRPGPVLGSPGSTGTTGDTDNTTVTGTGKGPTPTGGSTIPSAIPPNDFPPSIWNLVNEHSGSSFFDDWDFFTGSDPTHGNVQYVDENTARSMQLVTVNDNGTVIMKVDTTPKLSTPFRSSVRITTKYQYTGGLLVLDAWHAPTGCATWPAFWSNGPNWPNNGEIDIMEGVNDLSTNQASVHTTTGCSISSNQTMNNATGTLVGPPDCASFETNNSGCGVQATSQQNTYGKGFNAIGGGVYAMVWEDSGISIFFFPRNSIPQDLLVKKPQPDTWGIPFARYPSTSCNPFQFFKSHSAIFDTTLCGDWAGNAWNQAGVPGQEDSCATRTGFATCADFVQNSGASFETAYWEVASVRLYQKNN